MKLLATLAITLAAFSSHAAEPITLKLWPNGAQVPAGFKIEA